MAVDVTFACLSVFAVRLPTGSTVYTAPSMVPPDNNIGIYATSRRIAHSFHRDQSLSSDIQIMGAQHLPLRCFCGSM
jgi:hypothetical protein